MGIMEKKMETTIVDYVVVILGLYRGNMGIVEKKMGSYYIIIGC